jgi:hypothetical protein
MLNRSQLSETKRNDDEQNSLIKREEEQPCFPTHNDRIASIDQSSIEDRCVRFTFFIFHFNLF